MKRPPGLISHHWWKHCCFALASGRKKKALNIWAAGSKAKKNNIDSMCDGCMAVMLMKS